MMGVTLEESCLKGYTNLLARIREERLAFWFPKLGLHVEETASSTPARPKQR